MKPQKTRKFTVHRSLCQWLLAGVVTVSSIATVKAELVLHYNFDEESGDALDTGAAPAADGVFFGTATRISDSPKGSGYALDVAGSNGGVQNYVVGGNPDKLNNLSAITLTWWMNLKAMPAQSDRIVEKLASNGGFGARFGNPSGGSVTMALGVNSTSTGANSPAISDLNTWIFCAVTYDGTQTSANAQWFIGSKTTTSSSPGPVTYNRGVIVNTANELRVGSTKASTADRTPQAWYDDVRIYNTALTAGEIEQIRLDGGGTGPSTPALMNFQSDPAGYLTLGRAVTLSATVSGQAPLTIIWQRNGVTLPDGVVTGGTDLLNADYAIASLVPENSGAYSVIVTNNLGSVTSAPVGIHASTIYSTEVLTNSWTLDPVYFYLTNNNAERGLAYSAASSYYSGGSLLVAHYLNPTDFGVAVLNAEDGNYEGYFLQVTDGGGVVIGSGTRYINCVSATPDGAIYLGNLVTSATNTANGPYRLYRYANDNSSTLPTLAFSGDPGAPAYPGLRWGDSMAVRGTGTQTEILIAPGGNLGSFQTWETNIVVLFRTTDGLNFTPIPIWITNGPTAFANQGVAFGPGANTFFAKIVNEPMRLFEFDASTGLGWLKHEYSMEAIPGCGSAMALSPEGNRLGVLSIETPDNFRYYSITDFTGVPELLDQDIFPLNNANLTSGGIGAVTFGKDGSRIYVLDSANGIKAFATNSTYVPPAAFNITEVTTNALGLAVSWASEAGKTYQAFSTDSLNLPNWVRAGVPITGDGSTMTATNLVVGDLPQSRFYKVRAQ
jgi:hypothetical protein